MTLFALSLTAQSSGLIAYYPFEGNGQDLSGNGLDAAPFGNIKYEPGIMGKAAAFDGKTTFFEIIPEEQLPLIGDFTINTWMLLREFPAENANTHGTVRSYIFNGHSCHRTGREFIQPGFSMLLDQNPGRVEEFHNFLLPYRGTSRESAEQAIKCKVKGAWRCVTFVRAGREITTYVDGEEMDNRFVTRRANVSDRLLDMNHPWYIGTFSGNNPHYFQRNRITYNFKGLLDEMRIYNRAFSAGEVRNICNIYAR